MKLSALPVPAHRNDNDSETYHIAVYYCPVCEPRRVLHMMRVRPAIIRKAASVVYACQTCGFECDKTFLV